jgi:sterol 14-demethylase
MTASSQPDKLGASKPTPPMVPGTFVVGNLFQFMRDRAELMQRGMDQFGPIFGLKLAGRSAAVLVGPEYQEFFFKETDASLSMDKTYKFLAAALGDVGFLGSPETYQLQRPVMTKPFKAEKMHTYLRVMHSEIQQWLDTLGTEGEFELVSSANAVVQNVAAHALMGKTFRDQLGDEFWQLYGILGKSLDPVLPPNLPLPKFIRRDRAKAKLRAMLKPIIMERRANPELYDDFLQDFVTTPLANGQPADDDTVISMIMGLMFAGHETTVGQTSWTIIQLLQHPDYLAKVRAEVDTHVVPGHPIDAKTLRALEHTLWAVQETARMHPSAELLLRLAERDLDVGAYRIPKGWMVIVSAAVAHFLPSLFAEPQRYNPLRFAPERAEDRQHRFAMIGFGGGVHKCTGMNFANNEMAIITAMLLSQFDLALRTPRPQASRSSGATRPTPTLIQYRRRAAPQLDEATIAAAVAAGCPHVRALAETQN